jgi:hypothetical protein
MPPTVPVALHQRFAAKGALRVHFRPIQPGLAAGPCPLRPEGGAIIACCSLVSPIKVMPSRPAPKPSRTATRRPRTPWSSCPQPTQAFSLLFGSLDMTWMVTELVDLRRANKKFTISRAHRQGVSRLGYRKLCAQSVPQQGLCCRHQRCRAERLARARAGANRISARRLKFSPGRSFGDRGAARPRYAGRYCHYHKEALDRFMAGDPATGCGKDFIASWRCGSDQKVHQFYLPPEAGGRSALVICPAS